MQHISVVIKLLAELHSFYNIVFKLIYGFCCRIVYLILKTTEFSDISLKHTVRRGRKATLCIFNN